MYEVIQGFRLSPQQKRLWQWREESSALRAWCVVRIDGALEPAVLRQAVERIISRHEVLRTFFYCPADMSLPLQRIAEHSTPAFFTEDLAKLSTAQQDARIDELIGSQPSFDFEHGPLLQITCLTLSERAHALVITLPALCADGLTLRNFVQELGRCYNACRYESDGLPEPTQYVQFSEWQNELQEDDDRSGRNYWRDHVDSASLLTSLPYEKKRIDQGPFAPRSVTVSLPAELAVREDGKDFLLACWYALLWRFTAQQNITIAVQFDGRKYEELSDALGLFAKCLPVQQSFAESPTFDEVRNSLGEGCRDADAWQEYFNWEECFETDAAQNFIPVHFSFEEWPAVDQVGELKFSLTSGDSCIERYKLKLTCRRSTDELVAEIHFDSRAFATEDAQLIARCFETLVRSVCANPQLPMADFEILSDPDAQQLLTWSRSDTADLPPKCIQQLFEEQAARTPDANAVVCNDRRLTYAQLNSQANNLAHYLQQRGVGPNAIVGLCLTRSLETMVGMWGILKAGGAYLPLDPEHPPVRLAYQLSDSRSQVLITQESFLGLFSEFAGEIVCLDRDHDALEDQSDENAVVETSPGDLAYVIFTSGSTGKPKGVEITHQNLANYVVSMCRTLGLSDTEPLQFANVSTLSADLGNTAIFPALTSGSCLHILDYESATDGDRFADYLVEHSIGALKIVPSHLSALLPSLEIRNELPLQHLVIGGEALSPDLVQRISAIPGSCRIINHYGPTETTIGAVIFPVDPTYKSETASVPIGRPITNMEIHILDDRGRPVPPGMSGELVIGGAGLAKGYLNQPEQTQARFIKNPFSGDPDARLYRTGDLARYLPDGNVEFLGRIDHQVKIRGYRIELGEIENALREHPNIRDAVVQAREDEHGHKHLVAYCVPQHEPAPLSAELTNALKQKLPGYMIPQFFVNLKALPLTKNGKVNRDALPQPHFGPGNSDRAAPQTEAEKKLAAIWSDVLGVAEIGVHDNFFEMGGDSVLSIQIIARARQAGLAISPKNVFDHPTIGALAQVAGTTAAPVFDQSPVSGDLPLLPIQRWFFERELPDPHQYNQAVLLEVKARLEVADVEKIARELWLHHDGLRSRFVREESDWRQSIAAPEDLPLPFTYLDLSTISDDEVSKTIEAEAAKLQTTFDLADGPLVQVAYFDLGANRTARLLLVVHHLVIDGVSWRILIEDLIHAWEAVGRAESIQLPPKTTSFKAWADKLAAHADELQSETAYWLNEKRISAKPIPVDFNTGQNTLESAHTISLKLDQQQTHSLLHEVSEAYHTQINDLLLTALLQAYARHSGHRSLLIDLEGHGREPLFDDVEVTRTIGWFTTHFPVLLNLENASSTGEALRNVKEQLRQIPNRGIGYGLLRYLSQDPALTTRLQSLPQPEVSFNYLGQFDQILPESAPFKLATEAVHDTQSRRGKLSHLLRVNANVSDGELQVFWTFSRDVFLTSTIENLAQEFQNALETLISDCLAARSSSYTPSDFPDAALSQKQLDLILAKLSGNNIEDIYTLSPMQEGMLFQSLYNKEGDSYFRQMSFELRGELNLKAFEHAWQRVVDRHATLRTSFVWDGTDKPLQVVHRDVQLPLELLDWRELNPEAREQQLENYIEEQKRRGFDLDHAPLIRVALIRFEDQVYHFVWSYHHILIDGWSRSLIYKEVLACYEASFEGREAQLESRLPFREYVRWLRRKDLAKAEGYWRERLNGFVAPRPLGTQTKSGIGDFTGAESINLTTQLTDALHALARKHQLTMNTLIQGAWALVMGRMSGVSDVVFGVVASGRAIDLPGSESMIGPLVNTLPMRVRLSPSDGVLTWLKTIQQDQVELREFEHSPLAEVHRWSQSPPGKALFETVVNFTNYFVDSSLRKKNERVEVHDPSMVERVHYAMVLEAEPGPSLRLLMLHDSRRFDRETITDVLRQAESVLLRMSEAVDDATLADLQPRKAVQPPQMPALLEVRKEYPLSYHQERLWFIDQFEKGNVYESSPIYHNIPLLLHFDGPIDSELLESSLNAVVSRHEALRTRIVTKDATTRQAVGNKETLRLKIVDAEHSRLLELALEESRQPFDLDHDQLVRAALFRSDRAESILTITVHHIVSDKRTMQLIAEELIEIYGARSEGRVPRLPEVALQYNQYSQWQLSFPKDVIDSLLSYWKWQLRGKLRALELPEDHKRAAVHTYTAATRTFSLSESFAQRIESLGLAERSSQNAVLLAAFKALLFRYARQDEIVVGATAPCRNQPGTENVVGPLANLLVLRSDLSGNPTFRAFLSQVSKTIEDAYARQEMPFDKLVLELNPEKDMSRTALFDVLFNFDEKKRTEFSAGKAKARVIETNLGYGKYDLNLLLEREPEGMSGKLVYNSDIYDEFKIEQMMRHFEVMLDAVVANPDSRIDDVILLNAEEERQQLIDWNATQASFPQDKTIHELFAIQAKKTPAKTAVIFGDRSLTYRELDERANQLAHHLGSVGVGPDVLVAVQHKKSAEMIVTLLGILKAGGAYLPLNPEFPDERLRFMIEDSHASHLVTTEPELRDYAKQIPFVICLDRDREAIDARPVVAPDVLVSPHHLAYCIYTSGSTGKPKGALLGHQNVVRLMVNDRLQFDFSEDDVWTMFHSYSFDFSVWEMYGALLYGGRLIIVSEEQTKDSLRFLNLLSEYQVTVLNQTPSAFSNLVAEALRHPESKLALRYVVFGGEELHPIQLREWKRAYPSTKLINMYGITETTVHVTFKEITDREIEENVSNIGRPIPTTTTYIVDSKLRLLPVGVPGEVCVGGLGVGRGYLDRDELTREKFIANPYSPDERIYRSGDLAKFLSNGEMVYLGRIDDQVQIRGFRVELGEVSSHLLKHTSVAKAEVIARRDHAGATELIAYVEPSAEVSVAELRNHMAHALPYYMVPSSFVLLKTLPITANGKVDRKALPAPEAAREQETAISESPLNLVQEVVAGIWTEVLGIERVNPNDNFLELGGHSLMATRVFSRIREAFQVDLPLKTLFDAPTLTELANVIEETIKAESGAGIPRLAPVARDKDLPTSFGQQSLWLTNRLEPNSHLYNIPFAMRLKGPLNAAALERCLLTITKRHESLRTTFENVNGQPRQLISPEINTELIKRDLRALPDDEREAEAHRLAVEEARKPFDLEHGPLLRTALLQLADDDHTLLFTMHHIISDGWSLEVLGREVAVLYEAYAKESEIELPQLPIQYADYAFWQREYLTGERLESQLEYWRQQLNGMQPLRLPSRNKTRASELGASEHLMIPSALAADLASLSRREGVTLYITLLAAFKLLLYRYTGQEDIVVGSPMANRGRRELEGVIGYFVNTVPLRTDLSGNPTFRDLLARVRRTALGAHAHQDVPLERVLKELHVEREAGRMNPFPAVFVLQNTPMAQFELPDITISAIDIFKQTTPADLYFAATETNDGIYAALKYSVDLFEGKLMAEMLANFAGLLDTVVTRPDCRLLEVPFREGTSGSREISQMPQTYRNDQFTF